MWCYLQGCGVKHLLCAGRIDYNPRLNNAGGAMPATRVEAMYAPELFGEAPDAKFVVEP